MSGELWRTNYTDLDVSLDPLKCTFWGYYISAISGCCALKFLHALQIDQPLLAHTRTGRGSPKNFNRENLKFGLRGRPHNALEGGGVVSNLLYALYEGGGCFC